MPEKKKKPVRRKDARPEEIVRAAMVVFEKRGFAHATMAEIAKEAGSAKGTLYLYFENKIEIFRAMVELIMDPVAQKAADSLNEVPRSAWETLQFIVLRPYGEFVEDSTRRMILRILISDGEQFPELAEYYYNRSISFVLQIIKKVLERGIAAGEFRPDLTEDHIRPMIAPAVMAAIWKMTFDKVAPINLETFSKAHLDLLYHSIKNPDSIS